MQAHVARTPRRRCSHISPERIMFTEAAVRELALHRGDPVVTSVYLDVGGRTRPVADDYRAAFQRLADDARRRARGSGDAQVRRAVDIDLEHMGTWVCHDLDRSTTRGVALFSCSEQHFFKVVRLTRPVRDQAGLGLTPRIGQLLAVLDEHERFLVALVDRQRLRLLGFDLGEVSELPGILDPQTRAVDTSVELGSFERHTKAVTRARQRHTAAIAERALDDWRCDRLIVAGPDDAVAGFEKQLRPSARHKIVGRAGVRVSATDREIVEAVLGIEETAERQHEAEMVEDLRQRAATGHGGVVGLEATLDALTRRHVATLLVSENFSPPGARCPSCGWTGVDVRQCPRCATTNVEIDDVVELAITEAVTQDAAIEFCRGTDLDQFGHIGAIERY